MEILIERLRPDIKLPTYATEGDSGMDVFAPTTMTLFPGAIFALPLGFKLRMPRHPLHTFDYRYEAQVRPRSGISSRTTLQVLLGTVDNFYTGEIKVILYNAHNKTDDVIKKVINLEGAEEGYSAEVPVGTIIIHKHQRIAQMVFGEVQRATLKEEKIVDYPSRGNNGFGHTGV